ncbi:hypothetical protein F7725_023099 [Dissostichus mawsoni]|uniref:Uncharacterized protein n=1 Tax=Dissostichus mawsoni TaxID=36200 RepID=A0A7J5YZP6_DISMA|nr:hypothetical protein F7725_023099 [Dissostichus mawsoni]
MNSVKPEQPCTLPHTTQICHPHTIQQMPSDSPPTYTPAIISFIRSAWPSPPTSSTVSYLLISHSADLADVTFPPENFCLCWT